MSIWQALREELRGAWRSLTYDLSQRAEPVPEPDTVEIPGAAPAAGAMASTGTAEGGAGAGSTEPGFPKYEAYDPPRRLRALAVTTVATVVVLGAAVGGYFAVVGGVGALMSETNPPPNALPAVSRPRPSGSPATPGQPSAAAPVLSPAVIPSPTVILAGELSPSADQGVTSPARKKPTCSCVARHPTAKPSDTCAGRPAGACQPPVPTPTGLPPSTSPSPSGPASPSPSESPQSSAPAPTEPPIGASHRGFSPPG